MILKGNAFALPFYLCYKEWLIMSCYINCPRCNNKISLNFINKIERTNLTSSSCNTHIIMSSNIIKKLIRKKAIKLKNSKSNGSNTHDKSGEKYETEKTIDEATKELRTIMIGQTQNSEEKSNE